MLSDSLERLMENVDREGFHVPGMHLPCWEWTGAVDRKGRPRFFLDGRGMLAKRALFEILAGDKLPPECVVGSLCRNKPCVRPEHLALCNDIDARAIGPRGVIGPGEAWGIRNFQQDGYTVEEIAVMHRVSMPLVRAILYEGGLG